MTPTQSATIPLFAKSKDVVVEAVTGSGKTIAFILPILNCLLSLPTTDNNRKKILALIISPTRELAVQTNTVLNTFLSKLSGVELNSGLFVGGNTPTADDVKLLTSGVNILVGTPGRIEYLISNFKFTKLGGPGICSMKNLEYLVLDEADRLLDLGFETQLNNILKSLPKQRRTGLFSATMTDAVGDLVKTGLRNPIRVVLTEEKKSTGDGQQRIPVGLSIHYVVLKSDEKLEKLVAYLENSNDSKIIVYFCTCACVDYFTLIFNQMPALSKKFDILGLHGKLTPKKRDSLYTKFTEVNPKKPQLLLCTDVAARGLDIPDVECVIQFDPPQDPKNFTHRCGRTARSGKDGVAIVFLDKSELTYIDFMSVRKVPMSRIELRNGKIELLDNVEHEDEEEGGQDIEMVSGEWNETCTLLRTLNSQTRESYEKSIKAFVSFVRSYNEHQATYIFRFKELDLAALARGFGLLHLPKMPELKSLQISFQKMDIDVTQIPYASKQLEQQRQKQNLNKVSESSAATKPKTNAKSKQTIAWSQQKEIKEKREKRREKKVRKKEYLERLKSGSSATSELADETEDAEDKKRRIDEEMDDWEELKREEREEKRRKSGK